MDHLIVSQIAAELKVRPAQVQAAVELLDGGATVPFIARYRKEATDGLDDTQLRELDARLAYLRELAERREAVLKSIAEQGKLTPELEAAVRAADAQATAQSATLDKLDVRAPRAGRIDSIPYKLGDQAPVGAPLAILLVGDAPYARVYVPEILRANVEVGDKARVFVDGRDAALDGTVRMIRSEASFTPYYALIGKDAARLSYLAEIALGKDAAQLPAGVPVRVEFDGH